MLTWQNWVDANDVMMFVSIPVIVFMIAALPWERRRWQPPAETASQGREPLQHGGGLAPAHNGDSRSAAAGIQASNGAEVSCIGQDSAVSPWPHLDPADD
jgi:hypothetical protein